MEVENAAIGFDVSMGGRVTTGWGGHFFAAVASIFEARKSSKRFAAVSFMTQILDDTDETPFFERWLYILSMWKVSLKFSEPLISYDFPIEKIYRSHFGSFLEWTKKTWFKKKHHADVVTWKADL